MASTRLAVLVVIILAVSGAGLYLYTSSQGGGGPSSNEIQLTIKETDPIKQLDSFIPANLTTTQGAVTLVIQNGDDEDRIFYIPQFNVNQTVTGNTSVRVQFAANAIGTFQFKSVVVNSTVAAGRPIPPPLVGYLTVTT